MASLELDVRNAPCGSRVVPFAVNTRDLGGLRGPGGRYVRTGLLYRGSAAAIGPLATQRSLRTVIDLRSESESGDRDWPPGLNVMAWHVVTDRSVIKASTRPQPSDYLAYYRRLLPMVAPVAVGLLATITEPSRLPILVCCSAGKDRTSVVCALSLRTIGIRLSDLVRDHALSARLLRRDADAARSMAWVTRLGRREYDIRTSVVGWTIGRLIAEVERTHGSTIRLLAEHGLAQSTVESAQEILLGSAR